MKRCAGLLLAMLFCVWPLTVCAEEAEEKGVALITEPSAWTDGLVYSVNGQPQASADIPWEAGRNGQALRLSAGGAGVYLEEVTLPEQFSLVLWFRFEPAEVLWDEPMAAELLTMEGEPGLAFLPAGSGAGLPYTPLLRLTDASGAVQEQTNPDAQALDDGEWHFLAVVGDEQGTAMYMDGALWAETELSFSGAGLRRLCFGGLSEETGIDALVDDVELFGRALSAAQVAKIYVQPVPATTTPSQTVTTTEATLPDPLESSSQLWLLFPPLAAGVLLVVAFLLKKSKNG